MKGRKCTGEMEALFKLSPFENKRCAESSALHFWSVLACRSKHSHAQGSCVGISEFSFMYTAHRPRLYFSVLETKFLAFWQSLQLLLTVD